MPWFAWMFVVVYALGWLGFVVANEPDGAAEGAALLLFGWMWPAFALGWIVSRPFA